MGARDTSAARPWSLRAILAEEELGQGDHLLVARPDAGLTAAVDLRRRLHAARLNGAKTVTVQLIHGHLSDAVLAALMNGARGLELRRCRLVVDAEDSAVRARLAGAGITLVDEDAA